MIKGSILPGSKVFGRIKFQWAPIRNQMGIAVEVYMNKEAIYQGVIRKDSTEVKLESDKIVGTLSAIFGEKPVLKATNLQWVEDGAQKDFSGVIKEW